MDSTLTVLVARAAREVAADGALLQQLRGEDACEGVVACGLLRGLEGPRVLSAHGLARAVARSQVAALTHARVRMSIREQDAERLGIGCELIVPVCLPDGTLCGLLSLVSRQRTLGLPPDAVLEALARASPASVPSDRAFRTLVEAMPAAAWIKDAQGRYTFVNPQLERIWNVPAAEWLGKTDAERFGPGVAALLQRNDARVLREGKLLQVEEPLPSTDGSQRIWAATKFPLPTTGSEVHVAGVAFDITEQKATAESLRAGKERVALSERNLRVLLDSLLDGIVINREGRFLYANQAAAGVFGAATPAQLLERSLFELVAPAELPRLRQDMQRVAAGEAVLTQRSARRLDGTPFTVEGHVSRVEYEGGPALAVVIRDVTEIRSRQERLQLADRLTAAGTLAVAVAHEINNPLTAVIGNLDLLRHELEALAELSDVEALLSVATNALAGADRIRRIVHSMRTLVRDTGALDHAPVALELVIDAALHLSEHELRQRASVVRDLRPTPLVEADETRLTQVLVNLLTNAAQAIEEGRPERHEIRVACYTAPDGRAVLEVRDDGQGIPEETLGRIFEPFYTTKDVGVGTGLGLAIVHRIVTDLGGEIGVRSAAGLGTTFRIELPAAQVHADLPSARPVAPDARPAAGCVLIVDDEPSIVQLLARMLQGRFATIGATSGQAALEALERGGVDVVLSDLMMPVMSGAQLYEAIAQRFPALRERVIFMTGGAFTPASRELLRRLPNPVLDKPLDPERLLALIRSTLAQVSA